MKTLVIITLIIFGANACNAKIHQYEAERLADEIMEDAK